MNYKKNQIPFQIQPRKVVNHPKKRRKCDHLFIDDACSSINESFEKGNNHLLTIALNSLQYFLENQKIFQLPQSFENFDIINILLTVCCNQDNQFSSEQVTNSISSLKYIFRSNQVCDSHLDEGIIESVCNIINNWEEAFKFNKENYDEEIISIGDLMQLITYFLDYDNSMLDMINSILPIQFLVDMHFSLPFKDKYVTVCFSAYFYIFYYYADSDILNDNLDESIMFFKFCLSCYQNEIKLSYQYNLWSLSELIQKLAQNFCLDEFIECKLHDFINDVILEDNESIVYQVLRVIFFFYSPFNNSKSEEYHNEEEDDENDNDDLFLPIDDLFLIENLIMIPRDRDNLPESVKCYSLTVLKSVFKRNHNHLVLFFKYNLPEFLISEFLSMRFDMKEAICSLFLYIVKIIGDDFLCELVEQHLLDIFIECLKTGSQRYEVLVGIKRILDKLQEIDFRLFIEIIANQEDSFQEIISEIMLSEDKKCAEIAACLKDMTYIEDLD